MEIRVYKDGESKKLSISNFSQAVNGVKTFNSFAKVEAIPLPSGKISIVLNGSTPILKSVKASSVKDFNGNSLGSDPGVVAKRVNAIWAAQKEVDSYIIGDDLSQKSSETIFTHNKAGTEGLGGRVVVDDDKAKLDITRSTGQGETSVTVSAQTVTNADVGTITGKVAYSNSTQEAFTVQGGHPGIGSPIFTTKGRLIAENGIYVGSPGSATELSITDLDKVPASLGSAGQVLAVNSGATALEFVNQSGGSGSGSSTLLGLTDTPSGFGSTGQVLVVNAGRTAMEFATPLELGTTSTTALAGNTVTITTSQALAINANSAKTSFPGFGTTAGTALEGNTSLFDGAYSSLTGVPSVFTPDTHTHAASDVTSGTFSTARIPSLGASKIQSGTFADARISESSVTQHQAALSITESQISDLGTYLTSVAFSDLTSTPTTIAGYGITDIPDPLADANQTLSGNRRIICGTNTLEIENPGHFQIENSAGAAIFKVTPGSPSTIEMAGNVRFDSGTLGGGSIRLEEFPPNGDHAVVLKAPASLSSDVTYTLPGTDGTSGQVLQTDGSGTLSFTTVSGGGSVNDLDGVYLEFTTRSSAYTAQNQHEGQVVKFGAGTTSAGSFYILRSDGAQTPAAEWVFVNANYETATKGLFAVALGTSPTTDGMLTRGMYYKNNSFTIGAPLYIDLSNGAITDDLSSHTTDDLVRAVGYALSNDLIYIDPSPDYIKLG